MKEQITHVRLVLENARYDDKARCTIPACWAGYPEGSQLRRIMAGTTRAAAEHYLRDMFGNDVRIIVEK